MLFSSLVFLSAFLIESIGSYISIVGLSALFSTNPVIIALALSLDIAKVVTVSFLYKQWQNINKMMKIYMTVAAIILMVITSAGAAGYLSAEFQKAIIPTKESGIIVKSMTEEKARLETRKVEIDRQISQLPAESVKGRQRLMKQFDGELSHINNRIVEIEQELPKIQMKQVDTNAHAGPILYVAEAFNTTVESAVKYVILLIIFVFDPLAVALIIAGNFLLDQVKKLKESPKLISKEEKTPEPDIIEATSATIIPAPSEEVYDSNKPLELNTECDFVKSAIDVLELSELAPIEEPKPSLSLDSEAFIPHDNELGPIDAQGQVFMPHDEVVEEAPKRKRGRKKKEESEPKPVVQTEEQLEEILEKSLDLPSDEEIANLIPNEAEEKYESHLDTVHGHKADVFFHSDVDGPIGDNWKPTQKVLKVYNS